MKALASRIRCPVCGAAALIGLAMHCLRGKPGLPLQTRNELKYADECQHHEALFRGIDAPRFHHLPQREDI